MNGRLLLCVTIGLLGLTWRVPAVADPYSDYRLHCQGCHGPEGQGVEGGAPPFPGQIAQFTRSAEGRSYLLRVPGVTQSELDDAHTAALMNWILARFDGPNLPAGFAPYTPAEVTRHRRAPLTEISQTRARLLEQVQP